MSKWIIALIVVHGIGFYYGMSLLTVWILRKIEEPSSIDIFFGMIWPFTLTGIIIVSPFVFMWMAIKKGVEFMDNITDARHMGGIGDELYH